jgi:DegV family protein with EDD domain
MNELNGKQLYGAFSAGGMAIIESREELNRLNVFPVPDGDTGSNLAFTAKSIIEQAEIFAEAGKTMGSIAAAALKGARGNSGILFAQFINGMSDMIQDRKSLPLAQFTEAVRSGTEAAYSAISNPVEGTMLTIMKDFASALREKADADYRTALEYGKKAVSKSLQKTKNQLEALKKAGVIDAGAKGILAFIEGFLGYVASGAPVSEETEIQRAKVVFTGNAEHHAEIDAEEDLTFRYCTEGYISGENIDQKAIREKVMNYGDSLIVAGSSRNVRLHIHTDHPDVVFDVLKEHGQIQEEKVDDMHRQYQMVHARKSEIALAVDSTCTIPEAFLDEHQIYQVPLMLNIGEMQYLDGVSIKPETFFRRMTKISEPIQTSQPNIATFSKLFDHLTSHYTSVISVSLTSGQSGTYNSAVQAAAGFQGVKLSTVDSKENGIGLGLLVQTAAREIEAGLSHDQIVENIALNRQRVETFVLVPTLKYLIRGGRVPALKGFIGRLMNVKGIIGLDGEGKAYTRDKAYSMKQAHQKLLDSVAGLHRERRIERFAISHANALDSARSLADAITNETGVRVEYIESMSPVLGAHGGPGSLNLALITEKPPREN